MMDESKVELGRERKGRRKGILINGEETEKKITGIVPTIGPFLEY
jgi:hypothetical protein